MFKPVLFFSIALLLTAPLAQAQQKESEFNPFSKPDLLKFKPSPKAVATPRRKPVEKSEAPQFSLSATLISVNTPMAIVNGKLLQKGKEVDGMRLLMVDEGRVQLRYKGKNYSLSIDQPAESKTPSAATTEPQETL